MTEEEAGPAETCEGCGLPIVRVRVLPGEPRLWMHRYRDDAGQLHVYPWCRLRRAAPRKRPRPFLGECAVCGGAHYTDEHE